MANNQDIDRVRDADEFLAAVDTSGLSPQQAERVLADPNASQDQKDFADEVLADVDSTGLNVQQAEQIVAENETRQ